MFRYLSAVLAGALGLLFWATPAHALDPSVGVTQFKHTRWTIDDGVPVGIYALAQTPDGFLWIGSDAGLHRFDGIRFEAISGLAGGSIRGEAISWFRRPHPGLVGGLPPAGRFALCCPDLSHAGADRGNHRTFCTSPSCWTNGLLPVRCLHAGAGG